MHIIPKIVFTIFIGSGCGVILFITLGCLNKLPDNKVADFLVYNVSRLFFMSGGILVVLAVIHAINELW